jgi:hypothetical protein
MESSAPKSEGTRTMRVVRGPHVITEARRFAELAVSSCDPLCREAIALAAGELAENIVKYGKDHEPSSGTIAVGVDGAVAHVRATNTVASADDARSVVEIVKRLSSSSTKAADLYRARLRELFAQPGASRAQLGLLRLAFEGGFRLRASFEAPLLQIIAERPCRGE